MAVHDMTWREFQLRRAGYYRIQLDEWRKVRQIAYWSGAGTGFDPKKTRIEKFMRLPDEKEGTASESAMKNLIEEQRKYLEKHASKRT